MKILPSPSGRADFPWKRTGVRDHFEKTAIRKRMYAVAPAPSLSKTALIKRYFSRTAMTMAVTPMAPVTLSFMTASRLARSAAASPVDLTARASKVSASASRWNPPFTRTNASSARPLTIAGGKIRARSSVAAAAMAPWTAPAMGKKAAERARSSSVTVPRSDTGMMVRNWTARKSRFTPPPAS